MGVSVKRIYAEHVANVFGLKCLEIIIRLYFTPDGARNTSQGEKVAKAVVSGHKTGHMDADRCHRGVPPSLQIVCLPNNSAISWNFLPDDLALRGVP